MDPLRKTLGVVKPRTRWRRVLERADDVYGRRQSRHNDIVGQRVLVAGIYRSPTRMAKAVEQLLASAQVVDFALGSMGDVAPSLATRTSLEQLTAGKFQNLNALIDSAEGDHDWIVLVDDDVELPPSFLDTMLTACSRFDFALAQPAQTRQSFANWSTTRRHALRVARQTRFVEIGPVTFVRRDAAAVLLPFPPDHRWGWGLDFHWAHLIEEAGLRCGVVDAAAVVHDAQAVASTYSWQAAQEEGRAFLAGVPHAPVEVAHETLRSYRRL